MDCAEVAYALHGKLNFTRERLPLDICNIISEMSRVRKVFLDCTLCKRILLEEQSKKLFTAKSHTRWVHDSKTGWLLTSNGNCRATDKTVSENDMRTTLTLEKSGSICPEFTPAFLSVHGHVFCNSETALVSRDWYKCVILEEEQGDMFVCTRCFFSLRKLRCVFNMWRIICARNR